MIFDRFQFEKVLKLFCECLVTGREFPSDLDRLKSFEYLGFSEFEVQITSGSSHVPFGYQNAFDHPTLMRSLLMDSIACSISRLRGSSSGSDPELLN